MSYEVAKEFLTKISTDSEAAAKADEAYIQSLVKLAADLGFKISPSDLQLAMGDMASSGELSDAFLETAAGGAYRAGTMLGVDTSQFSGKYYRS